MKMIEGLHKSREKSELNLINLSTFTEGRISIFEPYALTYKQRELIKKSYEALKEARDNEQHAHHST